MDQEKTLNFLWSTAHSYASTCPQLAAHLMERFSVRAGKAAPLSCRTAYCPRCSTVFTCDNSWTKMVKAKTLRAWRRRAHSLKGNIQLKWLYKPLSRHRKYFIVSCKECGDSFVVNGLSKPTHSSQSSPHLHNVSPAPVKQNGKRSRRRSSLLNVKMKVRRQSLEKQTKPPTPALLHFLSSLPN